MHVSIVAGVLFGEDN